jgi:hypothetical protein
MGIDANVCYDYKTDEVVGPHSNMLVMIARGLFSDWKQIIYYNINPDEFTADEFLSIIQAVRESGINVRAIVNDMRP